MGINIKAKQAIVNVGKYEGTYRYIMSAEMYNKQSQDKVLEEASIRSGISKGTITAAWAAIGQVIRAWATEGHSVPVPGLGTMRFSVRATSVENVGDVSASLITSRRVIFTPNVDIKNELKKTAISITCYDKDGNVVKQVVSDDKGEVEDESTKTEGDDTNSGSNGDDIVDPLG